MMIRLITALIVFQGCGGIPWETDKKYTTQHGIEIHSIDGSDYPNRKIVESLTTDLLNFHRVGSDAVNGIIVVFSESHDFVKRECYDTNNVSKSFENKGGCFIIPNKWSIVQKKPGTVFWIHTYLHELTHGILWYKYDDVDTEHESDVWSDVDALAFDYY